MLSSVIVVGVAFVAGAAAAVVSPLFRTVVREIVRHPLRRSTIVAVGGQVRVLEEEDEQRPHRRHHPIPVA